MAYWTLASIRQKVRQVTGRFSGNELSNEELDLTINQYYQLIFPEEAKLSSELTFYEFLTEPCQALYEQPLEKYSHFKQEASLNNFPLVVYSDPQLFFQQTRWQYAFKVPWKGNGETTHFATTFLGFPILPNSLTISDGIENFEDKNITWTTENVLITGSKGGGAMINYSTGAVEVDFFNAPSYGQDIHVNYIPFFPRKPQSILFYNNKFQLFPIPDQAYKIKIPAYKIVEPLIKASDKPQLQEWGLCIVYGTAKEIFSSFGEMEAFAEISVLHQEQLNIVLQRTLNNLTDTRSIPSF